MTSPFRSSPADGRAILVVALSGWVCGVDAQTGQWLWKNELAGGGGGEVSLAVSHQLVVASAFNGLIFGLDYPTGCELWRAATSSAGRASIVLDGERIYVAKAGVLDCFTRSGQRLWRQDLPRAGMGRSALGFPDMVVPPGSVSVPKARG